MKPRKWIILIAIPLCLLVLCLGLLLGKNISIGRCVVADNGHYLLVVDNSPISISDRSATGVLFQGLKTGDKILVVHDGVAESYPGRTGAFLCIKLGDGALSDIPTGVIDSLTELGWLSGLTAHIEIDYAEPLTGTTVEYSRAPAYMQLVLPDNWTYTIYYEDPKSTACFGIQFWPKDCESGKLALYYYPNRFGVCGTGLKEIQTTLSSSLRCIVGSYANRPFLDYASFFTLPWDFISFPDTAYSYAVINEGADIWWDTYGQEAMRIIDTITLNS